MNEYHFWERFFLYKQLSTAKKYAFFYEKIKKKKNLSFFAILWESVFKVAKKINITRVESDPQLHTERVH